MGAHLGRQFEFVQSEWMNDGSFFGDGSTKDPVAAISDEGGTFDIPKRPLRRRLTGISRFVVNRGGEYCFLPSLAALKWIAELKT